MKCLAFVVASPRLLESRARTIEQMRLINALCRFADLAHAPGEFGRDEVRRRLRRFGHVRPRRCR